MKRLIAIMSILGISMLLLNSCSKDKDPKDSDLFIGTYEGTISYKSDTDDKATSTGKVTVSKIGDTYNFTFSDGIPNVNNITFIKEDDVFSVNVGSSATSYIRINASTLKMLYKVDDQLWTADCTR